MFFIIQIFINIYRRHIYRYISVCFAWTMMTMMMAMSGILDGVPATVGIYDNVNCSGCGLPYGHFTAISRVVKLMNLFAADAVT